MPPFTARPAAARSAPCWRRSRATSGTTRSAPAAPFAAAWQTPTRRRNGAWWRRRSMPLCGRSVPAANGSSPRAFFRGAMETALAADELLCEARLPALPPDTRWGFAEFGRRAGDFALAMALAAYRVEAGIIVAPRLGVGAVEAAPRRIAAAEAAL